MKLKPMFSSSVDNMRKSTLGGYGVVHTGGMEFEARKRRKVDLISFDTAIETRVVKFLCTTEHRDLSSYVYSFYISQFGSKVHEYFINI